MRLCISETEGGRNFPEDRCYSRIVAQDLLCLPFHLKATPHLIITRRCLKNIMVLVTNKLQLFLKDWW